MKNILHAVILIVSALAALSFAQKQDSRVTLAVSELEGRGLAAGEALTLTDALAGHLASSNAFRIMERGKMDMILKEQGFQQSGACTDQACLVEMGQLLGVQQMITGSIGKVGATFSINVRMINVSTSEITRTVSKVYKGQIDGVLTDVMPVVASDLAQAATGQAKAASSSAPSASTVVPVSQPAPAPEPSLAKSEGKSHTWLWVGVGAVVVAGGVTAAVLLGKKSSDKTPDNTPSGPTGSMELTW